MAVQLELRALQAKLHVLLDAAHHDAATLSRMLFEFLSPDITLVADVEHVSQRPAVDEGLHLEVHTHRVDREIIMRQLASFLCVAASITESVLPRRPSSNRFAAHRRARHGLDGRRAHPHVGRVLGRRLRLRALPPSSCSAARRSSDCAATGAHGGFLGSRRLWRSLRCLEMHLELDREQQHVAHHVVQHAVLQHADRLHLALDGARARLRVAAVGNVAHIHAPPQ